MWYFQFYKSPIQPLNNMKKWLTGAALELPPGLTCPGPCKPMLKKNINDLPANLILYSQNSSEYTLAFYNNINTRFDLFLKN